MTDDRPQQTPAEVAARNETDRIRRLAADARADLEQISDLRNQIDFDVARDLNGPRPAPGSRVLFDVRLWDLHHGIDLWNWCLLAIDEMSSLDEDDRINTAPNARNPTVHAMCRFLSEQAEWIITYNDDFPDAIHQLHRAYAKAAGVKRDIVYRCSACEWRVQPEDGGTWFRCTGCGKTWTLAAEIDRLMSRQDQVMTLNQISRELGQPARTLRHWASQGRFLPVGQKRGRPLYDIRHVKRAVERVRKAS